MLFVCECMRVSVYVCCASECVCVCVRVCVIVLCTCIYKGGGSVWMGVWGGCGCVKREKMCVTSA